MAEVILECNDCQHTNRQNLGMPGYQHKTWIFSSFSEAHKHLIENPEHYVSISVRVDRDDEDD